MTRHGFGNKKPAGNRRSGKKTRQGAGRFSKWVKSKRSKLYKKKYRGQGGRKR